MSIDQSDLEDFFDNGEVGLHIVASDGTVLRANNAELNMLGYEASEYIGRPIADFHADKNVIDDILHHLAAGEKLCRYPARLRAKDGSIRHVLITSSGKFDNGHFVSTRCFTVDVTEAKVAEERRQWDEHRFRAILDALPTALYTTDADGRITYFNEAAVNFSGNRPTLGDDKWCVSWRLYRTDGTALPHDECPMAIALREDRPVRDVQAFAERPDGTRVPFLPFPTPLHDAEGKLIGAVNLLMDLTELHKAQTDQAWLAAIVESSEDAIVSKTLDGRITSWNAGAARIFGYGPDEMIGQSIKRVIPAELHEEEDQILARLARGERIDHFETVRVAKDGRRVDVSLAVSPIRDAAGNVRGASKVGRDITERRQVEKTQQLLLQELNHRVKNTLASVQAIVQHTLRSTKDPVAFAASFSGRIQSLSRVHSLLTNTTWKGADLRDLIRDQVMLGPADETRLTAWGPAVQLEPQMTLHLALMLHELATNSAKYGALSVREGWITISWIVRNGVLELQWVERGGPVVSVPMTRGFGTKLIEQSAMSEGGTAEMVCDADGLSWNIALPLPGPEVSAAKERTAEHVVLNATQTIASTDNDARAILAGRRLLVVEDEPLVAMDIVGGLQDAGGEITGPAGTEQHALSLIESTKLDAALLDCNLHGRPVDAIAAALARNNVPFIFVTGHTREALPQAFAGAGLLTKPFSQEQLVNAVAGVLTRSSTITRLKA